jgi:hypothetical protein
MIRLPNRYYINIDRRELEMDNTENNLHELMGFEKQ